MRGALALALVLGVAACGDDAMLAAEPATPVPAALLGEFHASPPEPFGHAEMVANATYFEQYAGERSTLFITLGHLEGDVYVAEGLADGHREYDASGRMRRVVDRPCPGTARGEHGTWTVSVTGTRCTQWNGTFRSGEAAPPPPEPPRVVVHEGPLRLVLPTADTAFAHALADIDSLQGSEAACAVRLHAPDSDLTAGETPGRAAIEHMGEHSGESFEVIDADSGEALPSEPESPARYQALYVRTEHAEPRVHMDARTFDPGSSRGRAFLVDTQAGRIVCVGDVEATNGPALITGSEGEATTMLLLQLGLAEQRAIALGLHEIAR